ncbi:carbohydrate binding protein [Umezawaea tangerina]|uniref:Carbohydrate binding protein n=1 Tax=Umezawaea tangerina TaxID=84725 RepID=A0A2T0SKB0_9PSEU|nr:carbohydrate-binding protein [Umezawaea tangerina]PRY33844.1 carbohydrate binding protein [Umezawaea tangerina]
MSRSSSTRTTTAAAAAVSALAMAVVGVSTASAAPALTSSDVGAAACGALFDDFNYGSYTDSALRSHGWQVRSNAGGPGVPGARWAPENVTFPTSDGDKVLQLASATNGTGAGTTQTEIFQGAQRFLEGTYASRIRFSDAPSGGADGDHVNQTFFTISPLRYNNDPIYSELDFSEYLPNGGWGETGPVNFQTSWHTYTPDPWYAENKSNAQRRSINGWHTVVSTVSAGHVKYYIDGTLVADHDRTGPFDVYPRQAMTLNFNQWFIDTAGHSGGTSTYLQQVDWVYYAKDQVLSPATAVANAASFRSGGVRFKDDLGSGSCTSSPPPPTSPTQPPATGSWAAGTFYAVGATTTYDGVTYRCLQQHTAIAGWEPTNTPALWQRA